MDVARGKTFWLLNSQRKMFVNLAQLWDKEQSELL